MKEKYNTDNKLSISPVIKETETSYQNSDINQKQKNTGKRICNKSNDHDIFVILN